MASSEKPKSERQQWAEFVARGMASRSWADAQPGIARHLKHVAEVNRLSAELAPGLPALNARLAEKGLASQIDTGKRGRHGERTTIVDGIKFRSKLEADRYRELKNLQRAGLVKWFLRQVPFDVSVGVIYRLDFLACWNRPGIADEALTYEETKGWLTEGSRIKIGVVQERYGIKIKILRRADVSRG